MMCVLFSKAVSAQTNMVVYDDALENGWQNWSWCGTDLSSTDTVFQGKYSIKVTYAAAYQGFYLDHAAFSTVGYKSLQFWINGGSTSSHPIQIAGIVNQNPLAAVPLSKFLPGGVVPAGKWIQVTVPLSSIGIQNQSSCTGFWLQESGGSSQPPFYLDQIVLLAAPPPPIVYLKINASRPIRKVPGTLYGLNTAVWDSHFNDAATNTELKIIQPNIMRFPGGSASDGYNWQTNKSDNNTWAWSVNFDTFAKTALSLGSQAFITTNYGTGSPEEAAAWVAYSNVTKKYGFLYWEIGNECYGGWEEDTHPIPHDPYTYAMEAAQYIHQMKAVDPSIKIGIVAVPGEDSYVNNQNHPAVNPVTGKTHYGWTPVMLSTLASQHVMPDFLIYHFYAQNPGGENDATLLQASHNWLGDAMNLRMQLTDYLGSAGNNVSLMVTENNSVSSNPGKQSVSLVNALYLADSYASLMQTQFQSLCWWDLHNGKTNGSISSNLYGWRQYGDYGITSADNTQLYPDFYALKMLTHFARPGDAIISASSSYNLLTVYAAHRINGTLTLLVINKSQVNTLHASISLSNFTPAPTGTVYSYGIPQDTAAETGQGSTDISSSEWTNLGKTFSGNFPPYSLTVITLNP